MRKDMPESDLDYLSEDEDSEALYNEELARRAVGDLFEDAEDVPGYSAEPAEGARIVTGFDAPPAPARKKEEHTAEDINDDRYARRRDSMPAPRPAVKVNVASNVPRPARTSRVLPEDEYEDDYDAFRRHPKRPSAPRPASSERNTAPQPARPRAERGRPERVNRDRDEYYEAESVSPVRWVAAGLTFLFLIILAFLVYRLVVVSGELKEAQNAIASVPDSQAKLNELALTIESQDQQLIEKDDMIDGLQQRLAQYEPAGGVVSADPNTSVDQSAGNETGTDTTAVSSGGTAGSSGLPVEYTVAQGDNLTKISNKHYGNADPSNITKIKNANGLTSDNISVGQKLTIPE